MIFFTRTRFAILIAIITVLGLQTSCIHTDKLKCEFVDPPMQYKPMPFWHINGELTTVGIQKQLKDAKELAGFSGISLLPLSSKGKKQGTSPMFLSEEYFDRYDYMIKTAQELGMEVILYDDNDFPSGMAGGKIEKLYPEHTMKRLDIIEHTVKGPQLFSDSIKGIKLMAAVALNVRTNERIEISDHVNGRMLKWQVPDGDWNIMMFPLVKDSFHKKYLCVDFMDTTAVRHMIRHTYDKYYERFGQYFGNTIKKTFFDDVGFWRHPRSWTGRFNEKFMEIYKYDPRPFYPALWYNIGPETESVRNAFFNTRAELLAEGFPKLVAEWAKKHGVKDTGHPPGNYDPSPIDMNGDIFKFYRHTAIPLTDDIINYNFGKDGHKLVSSAADFYDKPLVATEIYGAYREVEFDSLMMYRSVMDLFARGVNVVIPHGMWYDSNKVYIQPLVSPYSKKLASALPKYSEFVGRASMLLRGGNRVSEIGVLYPFEELAGWFRFDNPENIRQGFYVSPETDYQIVSNWLTNSIRRDFTFVHPELFLDDKYTVEKGNVILNNAENKQMYHTMILTGCSTASYKTLQKLRTFYNNGGTIIATTQLPYKSSELGKDQEVVKIVKEIFRIDPLNQKEYTDIVRSENSAKGKAFFIPKPDSGLLSGVLDESERHPDVIFKDDIKLKSDIGRFNYIHKEKDGVSIYYFTNSSDKKIETEVMIRGKLDLEKWNPHNGVVSDIEEQRSEIVNDQYYTKCDLKLEPVSSIFFMTKR